MFRLIFLLCLVFYSAASYACSVVAGPDISKIGRTVIINTNILTPSADKFLAGRDVYIDNKTGHIEKITPHTDGTIFTSCDSFIKGDGKYLIPGIAEMHGHLPFKNWPQDYTNETLFLYVAAGVTTVRGMLGNDVQFQLRRDINDNKRMGPNLYLAAPSLNGRSVTSPEQGRDLVRKYAAAGWDLLKIHPGLSRKSYLAIADEAKKQNIRLGGHVPEDVGLDLALKVKQSSLDHMDGYIARLNGFNKDLQEEDIKKLIPSTLASGTFIVPTQALFNLLRSGGDVKVLSARFENKYMPRSALKSWQNRINSNEVNTNKKVAKNRQKILKILADHGVPIAMGSDAPQLFSVPGFSIWREIEVMRDAGLTPAQILKAAGPAAGDYFPNDKFGQIKAGYRADLLLLSANPLENIMNIVKQDLVMVAGRRYTREYIDTELKKIEMRHQN